jgi:periplasmic copper chaperone A
MRALIAGFTAAFLALAAYAQEPGIAVEQAWARATPGAVKTGAAYLTLVNNGKQSDRLLGMSTPVADSASLHETKMEGGIMKMRPLGPVDLAPGKSLELKPGGNHIMLEGLKHPLKEGEHFPLTLAFEKAGTREVTVMVGKVGAMGPAGMTMDSGAMNHINMTH